jgi:hypothetical protein
MFFYFLFSGGLQSGYRRQLFDRVNGIITKNILQVGHEAKQAILDV